MKSTIKKAFLGLLATTIASHANPAFLAQLAQHADVALLRSQTNGLFSIIKQEQASGMITNTLSQTAIALVDKKKLQVCLGLGKMKMLSQLSLELVRNGDSTETVSNPLSGILDRHTAVQNAFDRLCTQDANEDVLYNIATAALRVVFEKNTQILSASRLARVAIRGQLPSNVSPESLNPMDAALRNRALQHVSHSINSIILWGTEGDRPSAECAYLGAVQGALELSHPQVDSVHANNALTIANEELVAYCGINNPTARLNGLTISLIHDVHSNGETVSTRSWVYSGGRSIHANASVTTGENSVSTSVFSTTFPMDFINSVKTENRSFLWYGIHAVRQELGLANPIARE